MKKTLVDADTKVMGVASAEEEVEPIRPNYFEPNFDEAKVAPYILEDPLQMADGTRLRSPQEWAKRRAEILDVFARNMFGEEPPKPDVLVTELVEEAEGALAGFAVRSQYRMWFQPDKSGPCLDWLIYRPRWIKKPVPVILFLNFDGSHQLVTDSNVIIPDAWVQGTPDHKLDPACRGEQCDPERNFVFPIGTILSAGYAVMTATYGQISPDPDCDEKNPAYRQERFAYTGVFDLWGKRDERREDNTTALGAWAWALSRGLDLTERIPAIDARRNVVTGCSRLGKAALLAAARDERFACCVPIQCGSGGATLTKRDFGENVATETAMFKHWFCKAYTRYAKNPAKLLDFDQHLLLAAVAPRRLLIGGFNVPWFDTKGEYLACRAASPAWEIFGLPGLPEGDFPDSFDTSLIGPYLGYYRRTEDHGIAAYDWQQLLQFAEMQLPEDRQSRMMNKRYFQP